MYYRRHIFHSNFTKIVDKTSFMHIIDANRCRFGLAPIYPHRFGFCFLCYRTVHPTQKYQIPQNMKAVIKNIYFRCSIEMLHQIGNYIELFPISYQITILYQFELFQYYSIIGNKSEKTITKILNKKFKHIILIYILFQIKLYL